MSSSLLTVFAAITLNSLCLTQGHGQPTSDSRPLATMVAERLVLSDEERAILRKSIHAKPRATTGSVAQTAITSGYRLPDSVELHALPGEVYRESPRLVGYRFIQVGRHAYVVDPSDRTVLEAID
ncbi:MAG: DUF1236 domain-containing protein [Acidobacteria bacterium]|nr:DUF1236 domain-containing protein [Acidobacteriota bacterium]